MTSVIIIAIALVLFIPITIFAYDNEPTCEAGYELISGNTECTLFNFEVEGIPSICADIKGPQIDPKMQGDTGLNNPQYMKAYREAQNQYHQQMQECIRNNQVLSFSDDMGMRAAQIFEENIVLRVKKALEAGCDMVLVCNQGGKIDFLLENLEWNQDLVSIKRLLAMRRDDARDNIHDSVAENERAEDIKKILLKLRNQ